MKYFKILFLICCHVVHSSENVQKRFKSEFVIGKNIQQSGESRQFNYGRLLLEEVNSRNVIIFSYLGETLQLHAIIQRQYIEEQALKQRVKIIFEYSPLHTSSTDLLSGYETDCGTDMPSSSSTLSSPIKKVISKNSSETLL